MGWKVIISPSARTDLEGIVRFVARHNSDAAARLGYELITRAENLMNFPEMGRVVPEYKLPVLREVIYRSYRIIYRLQHDNQRIDIVRFWHGARGVPNIGGLFQ
ncbi:MAG TPA: type II toxin-antitoxin system RelE/ParE family toxin [Verrucomicrobiae bacterium]|nr:type II toxin-antitoxin system RelE/ParE family toxin [Verrucomicrobiae bacterium]